MLITLNLTTKNFCSEKLKYEIKFSALASVLKNVQTTQTHSYTSCSEDDFSMEHGLCSWKSKNCQSLYHCKHAKVKTCQYLKNQSPKTFVLCQKYISNHGKNKSLKCCWVFFFFFLILFYFLILVVLELHYCHTNLLLPALKAVSWLHHWKVADFHPIAVMGFMPQIQTKWISL